jgi:rhodanese-related sulfurtransferase
MEHAIGGSIPRMERGSLTEDKFHDVLPEQLRDWLAEGRPLKLIDVREESEWAICRLPGAELMPVGKIAEWSETLDPQQEILLYCHHGIRSLHAAMTLARKGFTHVLHLRGGLDAYSLKADPSMTRY